MKYAKILILLIAISVSTAKQEPSPPSKEQLAMMSKLCIEAGDKEECQALIEANVLPRLQFCAVSCDSIGEDNNCYKSCNNVGIIHLVAQDYQKSISYAKKSIELGNPYPYFWLDTLHYKSGNIEALQMLEKACNDKKDKELQAATCNVLGGVYLKGKGIFGAGKGVYQNYKKAYEYFKKSCDEMAETGNTKSGCYMLGYLHAQGKGTRQNSYLAKEYYGKSCDMGEQGACNIYKDMQ